MTTTFIHSYRFPTGKSYLALFAKRSYSIRPGARAEPSDADEAIVDAPVYEDSINPGAGNRLVHDSDLFCSEKAFTDILVRGSAISTRGPVTELIASVQVESAKKQVRATGDRKIEFLPGGGISFSKPDYFQRMPLLWDHAFGGRDAYAEAKLNESADRFNRSRKGIAGLTGPVPSPKEGGYSVSYPRNIAGRGFWIDIDRDRLQGERLPNLDDPDDPLTPERLLISDPLDWMDLPAAASFEPIDAFTFPRAVFMLPHASNPPKRPLYELSVGALLKADLADTRLHKLPPNPRVYNCAPAGLAVVRLHGGERVKIHNMHPKYDRFEFDLPGEEPRMLIEPPGCPVAEIEPRLQTVLIEPEDERVTLTWAGTLEVAAPFPPEMCRSMRNAVTFHR